MAKSRSFGFFEQDELTNVKESIKYVKDKAGKTLDDKANGELHDELKNNRMASNSFADAQTVNAASNNGQDMSASQNGNSKQLVRKAPNAPKVISTVNDSEPVTQTASDQFRNVPSAENPFDSLRSGGGNTNASTILIVLASFVIVIMLVIICLTVLNAFGIGPY